MTYLKLSLILRPQTPGRNRLIYLVWYIYGNLNITKCSFNICKYYKTVTSFNIFILPMKKWKHVHVSHDKTVAEKETTLELWGGNLKLDLLNPCLVPFPFTGKPSAIVRIFKLCPWKCKKSWRIFLWQNVFPIIVLQSSWKQRRLFWSNTSKLSYFKIVSTFSGCMQWFHIKLDISELSLIILPEIILGYWAVHGCLYAAVASCS